MNAIIFDELVRNIFEETTGDRLLAIVGSYDVDGVILNCTELPLIIGQQDTPLPVLDTLALHVAAALDYALGD